MEPVGGWGECGWRGARHSGADAHIPEKVTQSGMRRNPQNHELAAQTSRIDEYFKSTEMAQTYKWSELSKQQLGRYAEYFVKMEFTLHEFDVYTAEVDDKGIDFIIRKDIGTYHEIQVKSSRNLTYIFLRKDKCVLHESFLVAVVLFTDDQQPDLYLVPSATWRTPNALFVDRDYRGKKSKPEWGLNLSKRNLPLLQPYAFEEQVKRL